MTPWRRSGIFIVNFEHNTHFVLVFLYLTLSMSLPANSYIVIETSGKGSTTNMKKKTIKRKKENKGFLIRSVMNLVWFPTKHNVSKKKTAICDKKTPCKYG